MAGTRALLSFMMSSASSSAGMLSRDSCCMTSPRLCALSMCDAMLRSCTESGLSVIVNIASNLDRSAGGRSICSATLLFSSKRPYFGFAAPRTAHRDCNVAVMPAFAMDMVPCSRLSWMLDRSWSVILSSSSMHARPLSASTSAPASRVHRPSPNSSLTAAAVRPAADDDLPDVYMPLGASMAMYLSICDFAVPGSPIIAMWMSPLILVPSSMSLGTPPNSWSASASFSWL